MENFEIECLCGAVRMQLSGEPVLQAYCHCDDCQTAHGAAYIATAAFHSQSVKMLQGQLKPLIVKRARRMRCAECGTLMFTEVENTDFLSLNATRLPKGSFKPRFHLHCQHAVLPVTDALPHYKDLPEALGGSGELVGW